MHDSGMLATGHTVITGAFIAYFLLLLLIAYLAFQRTHNLDDLILGGRRLGRWVAALSAGASDMSGWLLLGLPGLAYTAGLEAVWLAAGLLVGTYLNWRLVAARLRCYSELANNSLTLPAFLAARFNGHRRLLRVTAALFILLFFVFYTSSGLVAGGKLFATVFGLPYQWAVAVGAAAIFLYTCLGGFLAVSWTDLIQALLMAAALLIVPIVAISEIGGIELTLVQMEAIDPGLLNPFVTVGGGPLSWIAMVSLLGWGLGYFGQPHILARFQAIHSVAAVAGARHIAVSWTALSLLGAMLVGFTGTVYLAPPLAGADTETVFMLLVNALFHPLIAGVLLAAILAAIMSTADSQLLVASSALSEDFYKAVFRNQASERELMIVGRVAVAVVAAIAFALALDPDALVLELVAYAWAGFGAAFGSVLLLALYWPRMTGMGAWAGMVTGGMTVVVWRHLDGGLFDLYEIVPGFIAATGVILVVSRLTIAPGSDIVQRHSKLVSHLLRQ